MTKKVLAFNNVEDSEKINMVTPLYGKTGILDSLGLVTLIAEIEEEIENETGKSITIADERAMSMKFSPFRNVSSLVDYIDGLLIDKNG